MRLFINLLAAL